MPFATRHRYSQAFVALQSLYPHTRMRNAPYWRIFKPAPECTDTQQQITVALGRRSCYSANMNSDTTIPQIQHHAITNALAKYHHDYTGEIAILDHTTSTNDVMKTVFSDPPTQFCVCIAEQQSQARGRNGRPYSTPAQCGIWLSMYWQTPQALPISTVIALATRDVLNQLPLTHKLTVKWPNDIVYQQNKYAGILVESAYQDGMHQHIIGVGINIHPHTHTNAPHAGAISDLTPSPLNRNPIIAALLGTYQHELTTLTQSSTDQLPNRWTQHDALAQRAIHIQDHIGTHAGTYRGIDQHGALLLETTTNIRRFTTGHITDYYQAKP